MHPLSDRDLTSLPESDKRSCEAALDHLDRLLRENLAGNDEMDAGTKNKEPVGG
jgi:hypothetical protein